MRVCALRLVLLDDHVPSLLGGGTIGEAHFRGVRKPLREEIAGNGVLVLPLDDSFSFILGRFGCIGRLRARVKASEVRPSARHFHRVAEAHLEDGPIGSIVFEAWDVCRELFDGSGGDCGRW